ncbi:hypothetical protein [Desulfosarcina ovata]|uniref:Uncharacterized protein n=1 Tax=Desulfosarcina ovata subsp. ovata TaxID=2752305 RepID=A0A5K8AKT5_9BACT|nr:hypothetical protein [Desulfosarcina ovata]BBO93119.1 hypothetical protein DSCOOX_62990 [Desulfosarcina ovata subsp. ovata]
MGRHIRLSRETSLDDSNYNPFMQIRAEIHLITLNLHYFIDIKAGDFVTIKELSDFVLSNIITPMAEYDDNYLWKDINDLELAYESDLKKRIDSNKIVKACIKKNDPFIPILTITHQYAAIGAGRIAVLRANIKGPFKDLLNLRHTTKTLLQTHGFAGPLEDLDLLESWLQMIDDQYSRRWLKKIVLLLDKSPTWKETLHHCRDKMQDEDKPIRNVDRFFNEMQMMCKRIYDTVTDDMDIKASVQLDNRRMVLWSIIRGHMMESIKALIELKRYKETLI